MASELHAYLGDTDDVLGKTWLDEGSTIQIPLMPMPGVVLFPDETLPVRFFERSQVQLLRQLASRAAHLPTSHVGIVNSLNNRSQRPIDGVACVGTTAEVVRSQPDADESCAAAVLRGRQRFRILSMHQRSGQ